MDIVYIRDFKVETVIGMFQWERRIRQTLSLDLEMAWDIRPAAASDSIEHALDARWDEDLAARYGRLLTLAPSDIDRAQAWFDRHGGAAVLIGRMIPAVRTLISVPAGVARMPFGPLTAVWPRISERRRA